MGKAWIATQIVVSRDEISKLSRAELVRGLTGAVARARELAHIEAVLLWPTAEPGLTSELARGCRSVGVTPLLWFPVLSDAPGAQQPEESLVMSCEDVRGHGTSGAWEGLAGGEERFLFSCPNNAGYLDSVLHSFGKLLDETDVDGVMLDKIRFPGPSNGFESLLCCFCPSCSAAFKSETGGSLGALKEKAGGLLRSLRGSGPAVFLAAWKKTGSFWSAARLEELAGFRARSIVAAAERFYSFAKSRGLAVGLDLFSPSLAPLVGQDYARLSATCDWMKPMLYCHAAGPAGLPLEIESLWKAFRMLHPRTDPAVIRAGLEDIFGWKLPDTEAELLSRGLPTGTISSELARMAALDVGRRIRVYAGVEAVRLPFFGIDITPGILRASLAEVGAPAAGIIASWNLLHIPEENQRALGGWEGPSGTGPAGRT
jgi:hypothetical protein